MADNSLIFKDHISSTSIKLLNDFSKMANKSNAALHPLDEERFFDFIINVVENGENLPLDIFLEWSKKEGWSEDIAYELYNNFEFGESLLKRYKDRL